MRQCATHLSLESHRFKCGRHRDVSYASQPSGPGYAIVLRDDGAGDCQRAGYAIVLRDDGASARVGTQQAVGGGRLSTAERVRRGVGEICGRPPNIRSVAFDPLRLRVSLRLPPGTVG